MQVYVDRFTNWFEFKPLLEASTYTGKFTRAEVVKLQDKRNAANTWMGAASSVQNVAFRYIAVFSVYAMYGLSCFTLLVVDNSNYTSFGDARRMLEKKRSKFWEKTVKQLPITGGALLLGVCVGVPVLGNALYYTERTLTFLYNLPSAIRIGCLAYGFFYVGKSYRRGTRGQTSSANNVQPPPAQVDLAATAASSDSATSSSTAAPVRERRRRRRPSDTDSDNAPLHPESNSTGSTSTRRGWFCFRGS